MSNTVDTVEKLTKEQFEQTEKFRKLYYDSCGWKDIWSLSGQSLGRQMEWYRYSTGEALLETEEELQKNIIAELEKEKNAQ